MRKTLKWILWLLVAIATLFGLFFVAMLFLFSAMFGDPSRDEVQRVTSADKRYDAVLFETNGGATTSFGYQVYVVPHGETAEGQPAAFLDAAQRSAMASGVNLKWSAARTLDAEYLQAKRATINQSRISFGSEIVTISFQPGVSDPDAPPGGMLHNQKLHTRSK